MDIISTSYAKPTNSKVRCKHVHPVGHIASKKHIIKEVHTHKSTQKTSNNIHYGKAASEYRTVHHMQHYFQHLSRKYLRERILILASLTFLAIVDQKVWSLTIARLAKASGRTTTIIITITINIKIFFLLSAIFDLLNLCLSNIVVYSS